MLHIGLYPFLVLSSTLFRQALKVGVWVALTWIWLHPAQAQELPASDTLLGTDSLLFIGRPFGEQRQHLSASVVRQTAAQAPFWGNGLSLLPGLNTIPGVRLEERSPGSYRLNIRGSALRSPFGVRNVKMYWNDLPFTDAGGNTYFNQLAPSTPAIIQVFRGPVGGLYGAGTGGLVLLNGLDPQAPDGGSVTATGGSFGLAQLAGHWQGGRGKEQHRITAAYQAADGWRDHTSMRRMQAAYTGFLPVTPRYRVLASLLVTDLQYQTPGGLNPAQFAANPQQARPAAGPFPGAAAAEAAIYQTNLLAGISNRYQLHKNLSYHLVLHTAYARVRNPSIRNYETRSEPQAGVRTWLQGKLGVQRNQLHWMLGGEYQGGTFNVQVNDNLKGDRGRMQTNDLVRLRNGFLFAQGEYLIGQRWSVVAGTSVNTNKLGLLRRFPAPEREINRDFRMEWMPRLTVRWEYLSGSSLQVAVQRGFSPPTLSEVLPSTGVVNTSLEAEQGWNLELAHRRQWLAGRMVWDINLFWFTLQQAIVQQRDASGADFFLNAGSTRQPGIETMLSWQNRLALSPTQSQLRLQAAYSFHPFTYKVYEKAGADFAGNNIPGVPKHSLNLLANWQHPKGWFATLQYWFHDAIFLDDANLVKAKAFHLVGVRAGCRIGSGKSWEIFGGADNLLDQTYGLGHDINAAGNRFFNAAARRNGYLGVSWQRTHPRSKA